jgi:hypothetical protein
MYIVQYMSQSFFLCAIKKKHTSVGIVVSTVVSIQQGADDERNKREGE